MEIDNYWVLCPYCRNKCGDWENFNGESYEDEYVNFECEECGKKFEGKRVVTIDYRTERDCTLNGEKHIQGEYHCEKCDVYNASMKSDEIEDNALEPREETDV